MKPFLLAVAAVVLMAPAAMAADKPAASADLRGPGSNTHHKVLYCVKNAESGACEDCWSDGPVSSARGWGRMGTVPSAASGATGTFSNS